MAILLIGSNAQRLQACHDVLARRLARKGVVVCLGSWLDSWACYEAVIDVTSVNSQELAKDMDFEDTPVLVRMPVIEAVPLALVH